MAEQSEANKIVAERSKAYNILSERSEACNDVGERSEQNIAEAEHSEANKRQTKYMHILDIGRYNLKRVCSSAKSFEARVAGLKTFATTAEAAGLASSAYCSRLAALGCWQVGPLPNLRALNLTFGPLT